MCKGNPFRLTFHCVASVKTHHIPFAKGNVQTHGRGFFQKKIFPAAIGQTHRTGNDVRLFIDAVKKLRGQTGCRISKGNGQGFNIRRIARSRRQSRKRIFAGTDFMTDVTRKSAP